MHACEWLCPRRLDGLDAKNFRLMKCLETPGAEGFKLSARSLHKLCFFCVSHPWVEKGPACRLRGTPEGLITPTFVAQRDPSLQDVIKMSSYLQPFWIRPLLSKLVALRTVSATFLLSDLLLLVHHGRFDAQCGDADTSWLLAPRGPL